MTLTAFLILVAIGFLVGGFGALAGIGGAGAVEGLNLGPYNNPATYQQAVTSMGNGLVLEGGIAGVTFLCLPPGQ